MWRYQLASWALESEVRGSSRSSALATATPSQEQCCWGLRRVLRRPYTEEVVKCKERRLASRERRNSILREGTAEANAWKQEKV